MSNGNDYAKLWRELNGIKAKQVDGPAEMDTPEQDRPTVWWGRATTLAILVHVAAVVALILVGTNDGSWILNDDVAYSRCTEGVGDPTLTASLRTERLDGWPVEFQCYQRSTVDGTFVKTQKLEASILQGIGWTWLKVSVVAVPLTWLLLLVTGVATGVGNLRR